MDYFTFFELKCPQLWNLAYSLLFYRFHSKFVKIHTFWVLSLPLKLHQKCSKLRHLWDLRTKYAKIRHLNLKTKSKRQQHMPVNFSVVAFAQITEHHQVKWKFFQIEIGFHLFINPLIEYWIYEVHKYLKTELCISLKM